MTESDQPGFWILGFGQDGDGELYVLGNTTGTPFGTTGAVYKLIPNASFDSGLLKIPAVNVTPDSNDNVYRARLQLVADSDPPRFELVHAEKLADRFRDESATFNPATGELNLSVINVPDANGQTFTYAAALQQVTGLPNLTFALEQLQLVK